MICSCIFADCKGVLKTNSNAVSKRHQTQDSFSRLRWINRWSVLEQTFSVSCACYKARTGLSSWNTLSQLPLSEALQEWKMHYEVEYSVEVLKPKYIKQTSQTLTEVFGTPSAIPFLDGFFQYLFRADIISGIQANIHYRPQDDYAVLVVWDQSKEKVIGTVQISRQSDSDVLEKLPGDDSSYAYISSMAVVNSCRRLGIGRVLLSAAEFVAWVWGENEIVLQVHEENEAACALYKQQDYEEISRDEKWESMLRPCTLLMRKQW